MIKESLNFILKKRILLCFLVLIISIIVYIIIEKLIIKNIEFLNLSDSKNSSKKIKTCLKLIKNIFRYLLIFIDLIIILSIYNINITSLMAGLGIVSVITGLALQDALKDIIAGINIILDNYYSVGDFIEIDGIEGKVLEIDLKVTKIQDINHNHTLIIANRNFVKALNLSNQFDIDIPIPYEENVVKIEKIINEIILEIKKDKKIENLEYKGIQEFGDSALYYCLRIWTSPENKPQIRRDILRLIKTTLDKEKISIPYTQLDIHNK